MHKLMAQMQLRLIQFYFGIVSAISPRIAAKKAQELMNKPRSFPLKERERTVLDRAMRIEYQFRSKHVQGYRWDPNETTRGATTVVLVHGWEGHAGNFGNLVTMLVDNGCTVIAFDALGHGESRHQKSKSGDTSMFDFIAFVGGFFQQHQPDIIITHSFGSVATVAALNQNPSLSVDKVVMITSPDRFVDRVRQVSEMFRLTPRVEQALIRRIEKETGYVAADINVSDLVQSINVQDALIIQGTADQLVPAEWSQRIAQNWARANLAMIEGAGHYRILWHEETKRRVEQFLFGR